MKDFDAAFAEGAEEPIEFRMFERDWTVSRSPRAEAVLLVERLRIERQDENKPLNRLDTIEVAKAFCGAALVEEWLELGITMDQMAEVVNYVVRGGREDDDPGEPEPAEAPAGDQSSNDGASSKRTSGGSTSSTSRRRSVPA